MWFFFSKKNFESKGEQSLDRMERKSWSRCRARYAISDVTSWIEQW